MRGFADGFVAVLLPVYLLEMGLGGVEVGAIATATLFGSAFATLAVGAWGHRWTGRALMLSADALMDGIVHVADLAMSACVACRIDGGADRLSVVSPTRREQPLAARSVAPYLSLTAWIPNSVVQRKPT